MKYEYIPKGYKKWLIHTVDIGVHGGKVQFFLRWYTYLLKNVHSCKNVKTVRAHVPGFTSTSTSTTSTCEASCCTCTCVNTCEASKKM